MSVVGIVKKKLTRNTIQFLELSEMIYGLSVT